MKRENPKLKKKEIKDRYLCKNCREEWVICPEDYESPQDYPSVCPLCSMPIAQMIKDTFKTGGIKEVIYWLKARYLKSK